MAREATARKIAPASDGRGGSRRVRVYPIPVVPLMKGGEMIALRIFRDMATLQKDELDLTIALDPVTSSLDSRLKDVTLRPHSESYSKYVRLDPDNGMSFIGNDQEQTRFELTEATGVAVIDLPRTHQVFIAFRHVEQPEPGNMLLFNADKEPFVATVTREIWGRLKNYGFFDIKRGVVSMHGPTETPGSDSSGGGTPPPQPK